MINKFGDLFFQNEAKEVLFLDTNLGELDTVCSSYNEFLSFINQRENIEIYLYPELIFELVNNDVCLPTGCCYMFKASLLLGGLPEKDNIIIMDAVVGNSIKAQLVKQLHDKPDGYTVTGFRYVERDDRQKQ